MDHLRIKKKKKPNKNKCKCEERDRRLKEQFKSGINGDYIMADIIREWTVVKKTNINNKWASAE